MALPPLVKFIYNHGSEEVVRRGKKIFLTGGVQLLKIDEISAQASLRVRNDLYHNYYAVTISRYEQETGINVRCQCPYNMGEICRHEVAALFHLNELILNHKVGSTEADYDQQLTVIRMRSIELKLLRLFTTETQYAQAADISLSNQATIESAEDERVAAVFELNKEKYHVVLKRNDDRTFNTSCTCTDTNNALCIHKVALFLQLINSYGSNYFDSIRNWDTQKNKLLQQYGFNLNDNLDGKFDFAYQEGKPILKVLDASIKKVITSETTPAYKNTNNIVEANFTNRLGIVINANEKKYPHFTVDIIEGELGEKAEKFIGNISKLDITKYTNLDKYPESDRSLVTICRKILPQEISKFISKNSSYGDIWESIVTEDDASWTADNKKLFIDYVHPKLLKLLQTLSTQNPVYYLPKGKKMVAKELQPIQVVEAHLEPSFSTEKIKKNTQIVCTLATSSGVNKITTENVLNNTLIYLQKNQLFITRTADISFQVDAIKNISPSMPWASVLQNYLLPLSKKYTVQFADDSYENLKGDIKTLRLYLSENGEHFIIKPVFVYNNIEANWNEDRTINSATDSKLQIIERDKTSEHIWIQQLQSLSEHFKTSEATGTLQIHAQHALKGNWFFTFFDTLKKWKIEILGFENLKRFKIKKTKPTTSLQISSGLDWFDTEVNVTFEGQVADINEIKKALAVKRNYVQLGDGTYGLLPDEWLNKYSLLFKMSEMGEGKLRVSKYNFSVIDELYEMIDDQQVKAELTEKKNNLLQINLNDNLPIALPSGLEATLRPYQESGFNWLAYLEKVQWGGLLADDMGLGKTIQTLTFLLHYKQKNNKLNALVVCPTTLIYNWENEIKKFAPELTYLIHHGSARTNKHQVLQQYNVVITTYGTLRSDIEMLIKAEMDYSILDESQAIKNPSSKVTKAAMLLHTKNRIALSGTPMQNNTFDIYAQLNFLNPGMLGTKEFFKENFATPIDKFQEAETKKHLRKIIYPFLLRRTKEQVATDLPDKTEITLTCEMPTVQRKIYDAFKNLYRAKILGTIEEQGIDKSQFAILQGLMKLRQICDSPAILKEEEQYENSSIKLEELVRELQENVGDHKVLIFSQFLGMLALIKEALNKNGIEHEYFDGSYTSKQRMSAIDNFQNNSNCRAFLISLKAGGTGLNLTAADYVYIMDPWWNPAVEQQAIDRTHRIGQTKNIFAYRFICKDTVEEKIVELKQKKNSLVKDIITDDENFVKKLSKEDVMYLFS